MVEHNKPIKPVKEFSFNGDNNRLGQQSQFSQNQIDDYGSDDEFQDALDNTQALKDILNEGELNNSPTLKILEKYN